MGLFDFFKDILDGYFGKNVLKDLEYYKEKGKNKTKRYDKIMKLLNKKTRKFEKGIKKAIEDGEDCVDFYLNDIELNLITPHRGVERNAICSYFYELLNGKSLDYDDNEIYVWSKLPNTNYYIQKPVIMVRVYWSKNSHIPFGSTVYNIN